MFETNLVDKTLDEDVLNNKEALTYEVMGLIDGRGIVKDVIVERIYVFEEDEEQAVLYFRKEDDDEGFYRGGLSFPKSFLDTDRKARYMFVGFKDILYERGSELIDIRTPLLLETSTVSISLEINNLDN